MIALASELYASHMLPSGQMEPKGDDADTKLSLAASHYFAGRSDRYRGGLRKAIEGTWDLCVALSHRKTATREEAEVCLAHLTAVFEAFSFIVPS